MKMQWVNHNIVGKQIFLTEKMFHRQLPVALINSIFLIFIITMKTLMKSKMR